MMATLTSPTAAATRGDSRTRPTALASAAAAVGGSVAAGLIALLGRALGAPAHFPGLQPVQYIPLVVIGVIAGAIGWQITTRRARHPRRTLGRLVPAVLAASFAPDIALGLSGRSWSGAATLMVMHLAVAAVALPAYARLLPLTPQRHPTAH